MNKWLFGLGAVLGLATALVIPSELSAAPFAFGSNVPGHDRGELLLVHCCHSHPYAPYDQYCCHPGGAVARTATGAAISYGAYRGVKSATKSAYKKGYNKAKKHYKSRR